MALAWKNSAKPPMEEQSGVVYWLDPTTVGMEYEDVLAAIPDVASVTSVSILAGPDCATALLPTGQRCHEYGEGLAAFLAPLFPSIVANGYQQENGITFKIVTSTAAAFSRMSLAGVLICPPRSTSCLFPALVMPFDGKRALVLDDTESMKAVDFFG